MADIKAKVIDNRTTRARLGQVGAIKVLSQQTGSASKLANLSDVDLTLGSESGLLLAFDTEAATFFLTDVVQTSTFGATGLVSFTSPVVSNSPTSGALVVTGGTGIGGNLNVAQNISIVGVTTLASNGGITTTGGSLFVNNKATIGDDLVVNRNLSVGGISTFIGPVTFQGGTIGLGDSDTDNISVIGEFVSSLIPDQTNTFDIGSSTKKWKDAHLAGIVTSNDLSATNTLFVGGLSTFNNRVQINSNLNLTGSITPDTGISYPIGNFNGPNGIAFFNNSGELVSAGSTTEFIATSNYILTTVEIAGIDTPVWTTTIDGGQF